MTASHLSNLNIFTDYSTESIIRADNYIRKQRTATSRELSIQKKDKPKNTYDGIIFNWQ